LIVDVPIALWWTDGVPTQSDDDEHRRRQGFFTWTRSARAAGESFIGSVVL
jgi:hypothetical protein